MKWRTIIFVLAGLAGTAVANAFDLRVGLAVAPGTLDPHHLITPGSERVLHHVYEPLVWLNPDKGVAAALATSWRRIDETTWEFSLRENVKFHDGADFTARDVIYSVCRVLESAGNAPSFALYLAAIATMQAPDAQRLIIQTSAPYPLLPRDLTTLAIVSAAGVNGDIRFDTGGCRGIGSTATHTQFENPRKAVGTGPYRLEDYTDGATLRLAAFPRYWGKGAAWETIEFVTLADEDTRLAALLDARVDMIDTPPLSSTERLMRHGGFSVMRLPTPRIVFVQFDHDAGSAVANIHLRQAAALALDRAALASGSALGNALPVTGLLPSLAMIANADVWVDPGYEAPLRDDNYDPDAARKILADLDRSDPPTLVLATQADHLVTAQAVARMLNEVGLVTEVKLVDLAGMASARGSGRYDLYVGDWTSQTHELSAALRALIVTPDRARGLGAANLGGYSNPAIDALVMQALSASDSLREELLAEAEGLALADFAIVPLYSPAWAISHRFGIAFETRAPRHQMAEQMVQCVACHSLNR